MLRSKSDTPLQRFLKLKDKDESLQRQISRLEGEESQVMVRLREEHGCKTLADAERLLKKLFKERDEAEQSFTAAETAFNKKWGDKLQ